MMKMVLVLSFIMGQNAKAEEPTLENLRAAFKMSCIYGYLTAMYDHNIKITDNKLKGIEQLCTKAAEKMVYPQ